MSSGFDAVAESRRGFLGGAVGLAAAVTGYHVLSPQHASGEAVDRSPAPAGGPASAVEPTSAAGVYPVEAYGAVPDGTTDNTTAFRIALAAADAAGGGVVTVGPGQYRFLGTLRVPRYVSLVGTVPGPAEDTSGRGAATMVIAVPPSTKHAFIETDGSCVVSDLAFWYPNQATEGTPITYPPTIRTRGTNNVLRNLYMPNTFRGIYLNTARTQRAAGRDLVDNVRIGVVGDAGIKVDNTLDVSRLNNVHLWPFYGAASPLRQHARRHAYGIVVHQAHALQMSNIFMLGLLGGLVLRQSPHTPGPAGASYGQVTNFQADNCAQGGIIAFATFNPQGWIFNNVGMASPTNCVACVNLSPNGRVTRGTSPIVSVVGGSMWGETPRNGWVSVGDRSNVCDLTAVRMNSTRARGAA